MVIVLALVAFLSTVKGAEVGALRRTVAAAAIEPPSPAASSAASATSQYGSPSNDPLYGTMHSTMGQIESDGVPAKEQLSTADAKTDAVLTDVPAPLVEEAKDDGPGAAAPNDHGPTRRALRGIRT